MIVTLLQQDIAWADPSRNRALTEAEILSAPKSDLYVLPEMWSTGFATEPEGIAEEGEPCPSLEWMRDFSRCHDAALCGSIAVRTDGGHYVNRMYFVRPDGTYDYYDKRHLFTYGGEDRRYTAGARRVVAEWRGWRFLLSVCYDLRFPTFSRNRLRSVSDPLSALYDAAIYVASWPESRIGAWRALLRARAIENQCYVLGVDRTGDDPACHYCGGTEIIDPYGALVAACPDNTVASVTAKLDREALTAFRQKFPVLADADPASPE